MMEGKKRRLSSGSGQLKMYEEDGNDTDCDSTVDGRSFTQESSIYSFPKRGANRSRRSSIGSQKSSKRELNPQEQARITEMYKTVIQLSTENKINDKNSWSFDLIDHMGRLIKDENKSVNFQKASCTLDASVKIYSHRVDDTYSTSHRILESLSRNNQGHDVDDADENDDVEDDEDEGSDPKKKSRVGKTAHRPHLSQTIEKNPATLNAVKLENDYFVDPMFHKISKAFDEGGAKGMLMNNLRLSSKTCALSFHFTDEQQQEQHLNIDLSGEDAELKAALCAEEVSDLLSRAGIVESELLELEVCPALDMYRDKMDIGPADNILKLSARLSSSGAHVSRTSVSSSSDMHNNGVVDTYDCGDDGDYFDDAVGECFGDVTSIVSEIPSPDDDTSLSVVPTKLRWTSPNDPASNADTMLTADVNMLTAGLENLNVAGQQEEYSFFDTNTLFSSNSNAWAGAKHWKFATKRGAIKNNPLNETLKAENDAEDKEQCPKSKKSTNKKKSAATQQVIDFSKVVCIEDSFFELQTGNRRGKSVSDGTLSEAVQTKADNSSASLFLPPDAKLEVKDLCRLFLSSNVMIPSSAQQRIALTKSSTTADGDSRRFDRLIGDDIAPEKVWGVTPTYLYPTKALVAAGHLSASAIDGLNNNLTDDCDDDAPFAADDYVDYDDYNDAAPEQISGGLAINQDDLLHASRTVGKIEISYAKVSKRVNIQRLKADIWKNVKTNLPVTQTESSSAAENEPPNFMNADKSKTAESLSFKEMITDVSSSESHQKDATLPFYFICLLHLANEHTLQIDGQEDMSDLAIKFDI